MKISDVRHSESAKGGRRISKARSFASLRMTLIFSTLIFMVHCTFAWGGTQFTEANAKYQTGDFKGAAGIYEKLIKEGENSAAVYYNLANSYFRDGQKARALIAYERALSIVPRDPDIRWNIAVLKSALPDRLEPKNGNVFALWIREFVGPFTINEISSVLTGILALWILWAFLNLFFPVLKIWFGGIQAVTFALLITAAALFFFKWQEVRHPRVVVLDKEVSVRYGPSERETKAFTLHEGAQGAVMDETSDWVNVMLADKNSGWLPKKSCELI